MAVNYSIKADVIDITTDTPKDDDIFLVDTNVWYWFLYPNAKASVPNQLSEYPGYLNKALTMCSTIHHSGLSLSELAHLVEKTEREIYEKTHSLIKPKEYRHNIISERVRVVSEIKTVWVQVTNLSTLLTVTIDVSTTNSALSMINSERVDGYDIFILESMKNNGVVQVITDDGDFATVADIRVFTANRNIINAAKRCGKLISR